MRKLIAVLIAFLIVVEPIFAALPSTAIWEINAGATASNVNGGGFNPQNANMLTDLTTDTNTGNTATPVVQSASYNFAAGDVGRWLYISTGSGWYPGWYEIASVASNKATLHAVVGSTSVVQVTNRIADTADGTYGTNTVIGIANVGTPTGGTFTIDYSQGTSSIINGTDLACADGDAASPQITSAGTPFGPNHVGNFIRVSAGTGYTTGWYEIVSVSGVTATLDRAVGTDGAKTGGTFRVGGALSMNSTLDDDVMEAAIAGNRFFIKNNGTILTGENVSVTTGIGTGSRLIGYIGYNATRGDTPTGTNRPTLSLGSNSWTCPTRSEVRNLQITGTGTANFGIGNSSKVRNLKVSNTSTTAARPALAGNTNALINDCEAVSYRGIAFSIGNTTTKLFGVYGHDSSEGLRVNSTGSPMVHVSKSIFAGNTTAAVNIATTTTGPVVLENVTLYGSENKLGIGLLAVANANNQIILNSIVYGFATGIDNDNVQNQNVDDWNTFYNNTANVSNAQEWTLGSNTVFVDPVFSNVTQVTGTGATSSTNVLTDGSKDFTALGVTTNDYVYLSTGTGTGFTSAVFAISAVGTTTLTLSSNITSSGAGSGIEYQMTLGKNFVPTASGVKGAGFPGAFQGGYTTGTMDIGGVQAPGGGTNLLGVIQ